MARIAVAAALFLSGMTTTAAQAQEQQPEIGTPVACEKDAGCTEDPGLLSGLHDAAEAAGVPDEDLLGALNSLAAAGKPTDPATYVCFDAGVLCPAPPPPVQLPRAVNPAPVSSARVSCIEAKESGGANVANRTGSGAVGVMQYMPSTFRAHAAEMGHSDWSPWNPAEARAVAAHDLALGRRAQWTVGGC